MPTLEEMTLWTAEEVLLQVKLLLPVGWTIAPQQLHDTKAFSCTATDEQGILQWTEEHADLRLLLFDLYGWLVLRDTKKVSRMWVRPRESPPTASRPEGTIYEGTASDDPADLDPDQVRDLYRSFGIRTR